jgi:hypothetical protein
MTFIGLNIPSCNVGHEIENNGKEKPKPLLVGSLPILMGNHLDTCALGFTILVGRCQVPRGIPTLDGFN